MQYYNGRLIAIISHIELDCIIMMRQQIQQYRESGIDPQQAFQLLSQELTELTPQGDESFEETNSAVQHRLYAALIDQVYHNT